MFVRLRCRHVSAPGGLQGRTLVVLQSLTTTSKKKPILTGMPSGGEQGGADSGLRALIGLQLQHD